MFRPERGRRISFVIFGSSSRGFVSSLPLRLNAAFHLGAGRAQKEWKLPWYLQSSNSWPFEGLIPWISLQMSCQHSFQKAPRALVNLLKSPDEGALSTPLQINAVNQKSTLASRNHHGRRLIAHCHNAFHRLASTAPRHTHPCKISLRFPHLCD